MPISPLSFALPRYLLVGIAAFALDYSLFWLLWKWGGLDYRLANAAGMLGGFVLSFLLNRRYTFRGEISLGGTFTRGTLTSDTADRATLAAFGRFTVANLVSLGSATLVLSILVQGVGLRTDWAKVLVSALVPVWNFLIYRRFVFACR